MKLSWNNISIGQFLAAHKIALDESYTDVIDKEVALLSAVTGRTEEYFLNLPKDKFKAAAKSIAFLNSLETVNVKLPKYFYLKGKIYDVTYRIDKLSGGQYIDISSFMNGGDVLGNIANLMAVICIPRRFWFWPGKYDGKGHAVRAKLFSERMSISVAYSVTLFFCNLWRNLIPLTQDFSTAQYPTTKNRSRNGSAINGVG